MTNRAPPDFEVEEIEVDEQTSLPLAGAPLFDNRRPMIDVKESRRARAHRRRPKRFFVLGRSTLHGAPEHVIAEFSEEKPAYDFATKVQAFRGKNEEIYVRPEEL
jgi:hypothetical protein